jgi:hypothetical protein
MALTNGTNLGLLVNGSPGEEHYNKLMEQWRGFDALIQAVAIDKDLTTPPSSPNNGDVYVVGAGAIGLWTGHGNSIARYSTTIASWEFYTPKKGWQIFVQDEDLVYRFTGTVWDVFGGAATVYPSTTPPLNPEPGDFWLDTNTMTLSVFYDDGTSEQWVDITGTAGPPGPPGATTTLVHSQGMPAAVWTIVHGLNKYPSATVVDDDKNVVMANVKYLDANTVEITHSSPMTGFCYLN